MRKGGGIRSVIETTKRIPCMSIHQGGLECKLKGGPINVYVDDQHPLLILGNTLPWLELFDIILPDLRDCVRSH